MSDKHPRAAVRIVALGALFGFRCGYGTYPPDLSPSQVAAMGVTQGIAGRAAMREFCGVECGCSAVPFVGSVAVLAGALEPPAPGTPAACVPSLGISSSVPLKGVRLAALDGGVVATVPLVAGAYATQLDAGTYTLALVDDAGCAQEEDPSFWVGVVVTSGTVANWNFYGLLR